MKTSLFILIALLLPLVGSGQTTYIFQKKTGATTTEVEVTPQNSKAFGLDGSGNLSMLSVSGASGSWGSITGTLSAQTDLQSALDGKLGVAAAAGLYQPLDADLTSIAALATTVYGRSLLTSANASAAKGLLGLGNVENIALSTWAGSAHITTLGTIGAGMWQAATISPVYGGTGQTSLGDTADVLGIPQPAGAWADATAYSHGDLVSSAGAYYLCTASHTSSPSDEPGVGGSFASYWSLFVAAGGVSDGDKGDIVVSSGGTAWAVDSAVKSAGGNGSADGGLLSMFDVNGGLTATTNIVLASDGVVVPFLQINSLDSLNAVSIRAPTSGGIVVLDAPAASGTLLLSNGSGASLTALNATQITSGTLNSARLGVVGLTTNGASSTPPLSLSGTWYTGGTSTTTKPQLLIEPSGTTSTSWSTNGTGLGINAASGFTGKLIDAQVNGSAAFSYTYNSGTRGILSLGSAGGAAITIYADPGKVAFVSSVQATNGTFYVSSDLADSSGAFVSRNYSETTTHFVLASDGDAVAATMQLGLDHSITATGQTIKAHDVTTGTGASLTLAGGKGSVAGGNLVLATSTTNGAPAARLTVKASGVLNAAGMPTSSAGLASGDLWNDSGTVKIVP